MTNLTCFVLLFLDRVSLEPPPVVPGLKAEKDGSPELKPSLPSLFSWAPGSRHPISENKVDVILGKTESWPLTSETHLHANTYIPYRTTYLDWWCRTRGRSHHTGFLAIVRRAISQVQKELIFTGEGPLIVHSWRDADHNGTRVICSEHTLPPAA